MPTPHVDTAHPVHAENRSLGHRWPVPASDGVKGLSHPEAGPFTDPLRSYERVLIVADFATTGEEFHRRLIWLARSTALLQLPDPDATESGDIAATILLEGLRRRLQVAPNACSIIPPRPIEALLRSRAVRSADLLLVGRSSMQDDSHRSLTDPLRARGCEIIVIDDRPEWDWSR